MAHETLTPEIRTQACTYLLHMLLQRLEHTHPGLVAELLEGAKAARAAVARQAAVPEQVMQTFTEAIAMLEQVHRQHLHDQATPER